ncbi:MAG: hypothetical protein HOQ27_15440 [Dermatophilaceae bacterium]|nr:hypothetical protein [Dermatophilaceae bacterium]NUR79975.1 hypothetical protein [Dermatophilaceae bacterium]
MADADNTVDQSTEDVKDAPDVDQNPDESGPEDDNKLGEGGKRALQAEREARKALERQIADLQAAQQQQLDALAKALGLKSDDTPPDPAKLTEQLTAEQTRAREAAVQLAVYRNASEHGANPDALLDSASFLRAVTDVDPTDAKAVGEAIKAAVEANPRLAADGTKPRTPRPDPTQGRQSGQPLDPRAADIAQIEADLAASRR